MPPRTVVGKLTPLLSQPRVVSVVGNASSGATSGATRGFAYAWPIRKVSSPAPPSSVVIELLSSTANVSSPLPPLTVSRELMFSS